MSDLLGGLLYVAKNAVDDVAHEARKVADGVGHVIGDLLGIPAPAELQLGQSTNPADLVHGDPAAIRHAAAQLSTFSAAFKETAEGMTGIDAAKWRGEAAEAFRARYQAQPVRWQNASSASADAAGALESYADVVVSAQGEAQRAIDLYADGSRLTAAAQACYDQAVTTYDSALVERLAAARVGVHLSLPPKPGAFADPGAGLKEEAEGILSAARQQRDAAASKAAATIETATRLAPAEPSLWQQAVDDFDDARAAGTLAVENLAEWLSRPHGYNYTYTEYIGPTSETGSPAAVMKKFEDDPEAVFPFPVTGCTAFRRGTVATLHAGPSFVGGVGKVRISLVSSSSFEFTVISSGYFDAPGSHITFSLGRSHGKLYLSQHGVSANTLLIPEIGVDLGFAKYTWQQQANNLRRMLHVVASP
jgi:hypothetical protein